MSRRQSPLATAAAAAIVPDSPMRAGGGLRPTALAVIIHLALAGGLMAAGQPAAHAQAGAVQPQAAARVYAIPAGPLDAALTQFIAESGVPLAATPELVRGKQSRGLHGVYGTQAALNALLTGTGLQAVIGSSGSYVLRQIPVDTSGVTTLPAIAVKGSAAADESPLHLNKSMSGGALGTATQLDTPFSTAIVTSDQLESHQVNSVTDAFVRDASVTGQNPVYTIWGTQLKVRGLSLDTANGYKINGLPVYAQGLDIPYEQLDSIQLLKGLSGFMYGFGAPGGIANFVTKKPAEEAVRSIDVGWRSNNIWAEHIDLGNRYTGDDKFGYRINATHEEGRTYNDGTVRRNSFSLGLAARLTPDLSWSLDVLHQERHTTGEISALATDDISGLSLPGAVAGNAHLATHGTYNDTSLTFASTGFDYRINPDWKFTARVGYTNVTPEYVKDFNYLESTRGDYDVYLLAGKNRMQNMIWQGMLQGKVRTGPFEHKLVFGAERQTLNYDADMGGFYQYFGAGNIYADNPVSYTGSVADWQMFRAIEYVQSAFYASDTMTLSRHWSVLGGLRYNNYEQTDLDPDGSISDRYKKNGTLTPTVALMYKPDDATTFYASYVEALESGGIVGSRYANANEMLKPLKSRQYEIGVKHEADYWTASAALFRMERAAAYANAQNYYVQDGLAVYQGLEVSGAIHPVRNLTLGGGLMLLDARFRRGAAYNGNRISGDPKLVATAYVNYDVPQVPGLGLYADVKFSGKTYADSANTLSNGGQALIGVGASYATRVAGHPTTYQVSINNLTDRRGWVGGSSQILPLSPRTFMLNAKFEF